MNKTVGIVIGVVLLAAIVIAGGYYYLQGTKVDRDVYQDVQKRHEDLQKKTDGLEKKIVELEKQLRRQDPQVDEARVTEAFGEEEYAAEPEQLQTVDAKVKRFFAYLDDKGYLAARGIQGPFSEYFMNMLVRLKDARPVITGEIQDLYTLVKNITFFFRIMGKENLLAARDIIRNEDDILEPSMALLFSWLDPWSDDAGRQRPHIEKETVYHYACYFLDTIAGQAYLFRRNARVRQLMQYYSILVIDKANSDGMNSFGVDIRPAIDSLVSELEGQRLLADRLLYLDTLKGMRLRYQ